MINTITNESEIQPLYVRVPKSLHKYLDSLKNETGISKSDSVTLILLIASRFVNSKTILDLFDEYMLQGEGDIELNKFISESQL